MSNWFTVKVKYTKQLEDGSFKRVTEPYLVAAMSFTDAEARIYEELGALIRGEFMVTGISRTDVHEIFPFDDSDTWYKCKINFESGDGGEEGTKAKKVSQNFLISAHSVKDAYERLKECLDGLLIDFFIPNISISPIVDIFPFGDEGEDRVAVEFEKQVKAEIASEHIMGAKTVFSPVLDEEEVDATETETSSIVDNYTEDED